MIPESFIQELLARVDVADVVGRYVTLRKGGANLIGLCPFHNEKTPSFTVSPTKQFYHCFGCGASGSAITFLTEHTGATFPEAVQSLASSVGLVVPTESRSPAQREASQRRRHEESRHQQILDKAQAHYTRQLKSAPEAIRYLKQRGVSGQLAARFGLGWSGGGRRGLADVYDNYEDALLVEAGLVIEAEDGRRYDRFRERVMFPIRNARGHLVGFGGRLIARGEPKYLNSPETALFHKGRELYGLWEARQAIRQEGSVVVVEGYMDVVGLAQQGIENAVATLGTATTPEHVQRLLRVSDTIIFSFDGDRAGRAAAWRALEAGLPMVKEGVTIRFLFLPEGQDPDSYCRDYGAEGFRQLLAEAQPLSRYFIETLTNRHLMDEAEGRAACIHEARPLIARLPASSFRVQIERELASQVRLTPDELSDLLAVPEIRYEGAGARLGGATGRPGVPPRLGPESASQQISSGPENPDFYASPDIVYPEYLSGEDSSDAWQSSFGHPQHSVAARSRRTGLAASSRQQSRAVTPMAKRLLRLLLAHPLLIDQIPDQQLEILEQSPHLRMVKGLITLMHASGARHVGALLQAAEPESELADILYGLGTDLLAVDDLPMPQAEWNDALARIELDLIRAEQSELIMTGLKTAEARERYKNLARRMALLASATT